MPVPPPTVFSDLELSRRLEAVEGRGGAAFAAAHARVDSTVPVDGIEVAGAIAVFDGVGSPVTQSFCLGLFDPVGHAEMDVLEEFFHSRGAAADHEVSPLAGEQLAGLLSDRGYRPIELTSVMFRPLEASEIEDSVFEESVDGDRGPSIEVRRIEGPEAEAWSDVCAEGWRDVAPELFEFLRGIGRINAERDDAQCFLAELGQRPVAGGLLTVYRGVALLAGASTIPQWRRHGAQRALLDARLRSALESGCDLAMMCARPGSASQRNAEREGFRIAYTRTKWQLPV